MVSPADDVLFALPRSAIGGVLQISDRLLDRMHSLLERNAQGELSEVEREYLADLVEMAQFSQLVAMAVSPIGSR